MAVGKPPTAKAEQADASDEVDVLSKSTAAEDPYIRWVNNEPPEDILPIQYGCAFPVDQGTCCDYLGVGLVIFVIAIFEFKPDDFGLISEGAADSAVNEAQRRNEKIGLY